MLRRFFQLLFVVLAWVIAVIAFLPNYDTLPEFTTFSDILNHFGAFFVLAYCFDQGFQTTSKWLFGVLFIYGALIEIVQHFLPNRAFELLDLAVDMGGVGVYVGAMYVYGYFMHRRTT